MNQRFKTIFLLILTLFMNQCAGHSICGATLSPENDADADCITDDDDNCPNIANSDQTDTDEDEVGDVCDSDSASFQNTLQDSTLSIEIAPENTTTDTGKIIYSLEDEIYVCDTPTAQNSIQDTCEFIESVEF